MPEIWTVQKVLTWTNDYFTRHKVPEPRLSAELLLAHILGVKRIDLYLQFERILSREELARYREAIRRRVRMEPVQYIIGEQEFMGLSFRVTPAVLIPRPETEQLVEQVLADFPDETSQLRVLDVGTGSGAIAISLARFRPRWQVLGIDVSTEALNIARENARRLNVPNVQFQEADATDFSVPSTERFQVIVANPPYVSQQDYQALHPQVREYEPPRALLAGEDGLDFYRQFLPRCPHLLETKGRIYLEIGYDQSSAVRKLLNQFNFPKVDIFRDYQNIERIVRIIF